MTQGSRAVLFAVAVVLLAALLAWLLKDGGIFTTATSTSVIGKFGYDAARDTFGQRRPEITPTPITEEYGD